MRLPVRSGRTLFWLFAGFWFLLGAALCSAAEIVPVHFVVDGRIDYNAREDDIAKIRDLISGVGIGLDVEDWEKRRLRELDMKHVQIGNAFNAGVARIDGKLVYDWSVPRTTAAAVMEAGAQPKFIISSATPRALSSRPNDPRAHHYPPADWDEYEDFVYQAIRYFNVTLAYLGYRVTYWDVHNEPDGSGYWFPEEPLGSKTKYQNLFDLYRHTAKAVDRYEHDFPEAPKVKIGGCRFTGATPYLYGDFNWIERFLQDCHRTKTRLDFLSFHFYAAGGGSYDQHANWSEMPSLRARINQFRRWIRKYSPTTELHITEWGVDEANHTGSSGLVNATNAGAAFAAGFVKSIAECGVDRAFFLITKDRVNPPHTGLERNVWEMEALFTHDGVTKAIANTLRMYRMMAPDRIYADGGDRDTDVIASRDHRRLTTIIWNANLYGEDAKTKAPRQVSIEVRGLPDWQKVICRRYLIDETHSNAYHYRANREEMLKHQNLEELEPLSFTKGDGQYDRESLRIPAQHLGTESVMLLEITEGA